MVNYYILGSKYKEGKWQDKFDEMLRKNAVSMGFASEIDLSKLVGRPEDEIVEYLKKKGRTKESYSQLKLFLNLKEGDLIAVKRRGQPSGKEKKLEIRGYAKVKKNNGKIYEWDPDSLGHLIFVDFLEIRDKEFKIGGYSHTIHKLDKSNKLQIIKEIFGERYENHEINGKRIKTEDEFFNELRAEEEKEIQIAQKESAKERKRYFEEKNNLAMKEGLPSLRKNLVEHFQTDLELSAKLKEEYNHTCQACGDFTFETKGGYNYTETHHILPLSKGGEDAPFNMTVLCPTCHRKIHHGMDTVRAEVYRSLQKNGISINFDKLLENGIISQEIIDLINP